MAVIKISSNITDLRRKKGITQGELANALGVSNQAVSKWESAQCCPDIQLLPDIAAFFGVTVDELLGAVNSDSENAVRLAEHLFDMCVYARNNGLYPLLEYVKEIKGFPFVRIAAELVILHGFSYDSARALIDSAVNDKKHSKLIGDCIIVIAQGTHPSAILRILESRLSVSEFAQLRSKRPDLFTYSE